MRRSRRKISPQSAILFIFGAMAVALVLVAYFQPTPPPPPPDLTATTVAALASTHVVIEIASSNTKQDWLTAVAEQFNAEEHRTEAGQPIYVQLSHVLSGGSQQAILSGTLQPTVWSPGEYSWVESANLDWEEHTGRPLVTESCPATVSAPSGIAMWRPMAEALGWPDRPIGWLDLLALASAEDGWGSLGHPEWGQFQFGHVHPDYSNVGLLMMTSLAYYASGKTEGLQADDVYSPDVQDAFRVLETHTYHYGLQSRDLLELMTRRGPEYLHAVTTSEAETLRTNAEQADRLRYPLVFLFPAEGTFWSEHPYCILDGDWVTAEQREAAAIFRDYLLDSAQQALAPSYYIRPTDPSVALRTPISIEGGTDPGVNQANSPVLESPQPETASAVRDVFHLTKKPATVVLVVDTSGSMGGERIASATASAADFIRRMSPRDEVYVVGFSDQPYAVGEGGPVSEVGEALAESVDGLYAHGNTSLFDAVCEAKEIIANVRAEHDIADDPHLYGIVLLSDGADTSSTFTQNQMLTQCLPESESADGTRVYTIAFGDSAESDLMTSIAARTNGRTFVGGPDEIERIYTAISAEQ